MKRFVLIAVFTILSLSCGYRVQTYPHYTFFLKSFTLKDPFLLEFKKDIEWNIKDKLFERGFRETGDLEGDFVISITVEHYKTFTVQSGKDNRQTAEELRYRLSSVIKYKGKCYRFKDTVKLYRKFPVDSQSFVDSRNKTASVLAEQIALRINAWLTKLTS